MTAARSLPTTRLTTVCLRLALLAALPIAGCGEEFTPGLGTVQTRTDAAPVLPGTGGNGSVEVRIELLTPASEAVLKADGAPELRTRIVVALPGTIEPAGVAAGSSEAEPSNCIRGRNSKRMIFSSISCTGCRIPRHHSPPAGSSLPGQLNFQLSRAATA